MTSSAVSLPASRGPRELIGEKKGREEEEKAVKKKRRPPPPSRLLLPQSRSLFDMAQQKQHPWFGASAALVLESVQTSLLDTLTRAAAALIAYVRAHTSSELTEESCNCTICQGLPFDSRDDMQLGFGQPMTAQIARLRITSCIVIRPSRRRVALSQDAQTSCPSISSLLDSGGAAAMPLAEFN